MYVKSYCSRNWRYDLPWLQETLGSSTFVPLEDCKQSRQYLSLCAAGGGCPPPRTQITIAAAFIWLTSPLNSKPLTYTFVLIKRVSLKWNLGWSARAHNPPASQITDHLNKVPIKIQSLSLLMAGVSNILASLGHTGRTIVLGHTLNTLWHIIKRKSHNLLSKFTVLCWTSFIATWGCIWPAGCVGVEHPCLIGSGSDRQHELWLFHIFKDTLSKYCHILSFWV